MSHRDVEVPFVLIADALPVQVKWVGAPRWLAPLASGSIPDTLEPGVVFIHLQLGKKLKPWTTTSTRSQGDIDGKEVE